MTRTIMIIGAAEEHGFGIRKARELGLDVFVTDANPNSPGFALANASATISTYDHVATLRAAREYVAQGGRIDGVMTLAADVPYTVAYVAEALGLPGIGRAAAAIASDKVRMKEAFARRDVPIPDFREVENAEQLVRYASALGIPVVVKPADSRGARGVQRILDTANLEHAYGMALRESPSGRVLVEEYLEGPQLSTEGFMLDGEAYVPAIFDRNYEPLERFAPFVVEDGGEMPSLYSEEYREEVVTVMREAALAMEIETGVVKGDLVIHEGRIKVIEIAARLSGGFFGTVATPASCGVDLVRTNIELALGDRIDPASLRPRHDKGAAIRFAFPDPGRVVRVDGLEGVVADPSCCYAQVFLGPGDVVQPITNHPTRPAVVVAEGESRDAAVANACRLIAELRWTLEPEGARS